MHRWVRVLLRFADVSASALHRMREAVGSAPVGLRTAREDELQCALAEASRLQRVRHVYQKLRAQVLDRRCVQRTIVYII
jgi:hypothetical protein